MTEPLAPVFFSTYPYTGCKLHGTAWPKQLEYEYAHLAESPWAGFRTLHQLRWVCDAQVYVDGSTYITRARSVATKHFLMSDKDVWLSLDDDVFVEEEVLRRQILACRATRGGIALAYTNRDGKSMTFRKVTGPTCWIDSGGARATSPESFPLALPLREVDRIGMGCVALHRNLIERLAKDAPHFRELDRPGGVTDCPALFLEGVQEGSWVGEDYYFSSLCERAGLPMRVLLEAPCEHQGISAKLDVEGHICIRGDEQANRLHVSLREKEALFAAAASGEVVEPVTCDPTETLGG
jgi:hypothetical protein